MNFSPLIPCASPVPGETRRADTSSFSLSLSQRIALFGDETILSSREFAALRGVSDKINQRERAAGVGCPFIVLTTKRIGYRLGDAKNFLRGRRVGGGEEHAA